MHQRYGLKDSKFMTVKEKKIVLKDWERFIKNGFRFEDFTKRLYEHLHLHCSFTAHFNQEGFYDAYFKNPGDTITFLHHFDLDRAEYGWWLQEEYSDVNRAMCSILQRYKEAIYTRLSEEVRRRDIEMARQLLAKHGLTSLPRNQTFRDGEKLYLATFEVTDGENGYIIHQVIKSACFDDADEQAVNWAKHFWGEDRSKPADEPSNAVQGHRAFYSPDETAICEAGFPQEMSAKDIIERLCITDCEEVRDDSRSDSEEGGEAV